MSFKLPPPKEVYWTTFVEGLGLVTVRVAKVGGVYKEWIVKIVRE